MNAHSSELHRQNEAWKAARQRLTGAAIDRAALLARLQEARDAEEKARAAEQRARQDVLRLLAEVQSLTAVISKHTDEIKRLEASNAKLREKPHIPKPDWPAVEDIVAKVLAKYPGVTWLHVISRNRKPEYVLPRHECMAEVYWQRPDFSFPIVARLFHRKDHTVVMYAVRKIEALRQSDPARYVSQKPKRAQEELGL